MVACNRCDVLKDVGPMNSRVEILEVVEVQDETGQPIETLVVWRTVRAAYKDLRGWERFRTDQELAARVRVFTWRWHSGLHAKQKLRHDDMIWDIEGLADIGRRVALEVTATAVRV